MNNLFVEAPKEEQLVLLLLNLVSARSWGSDGLAFRQLLFRLRETNSRASLFPPLNMTALRSETRELCFGQIESAICFRCAQPRKSPPKRSLDPAIVAQAV